MRIAVAETNGEYTLTLQGGWITDLVVERINKALLCKCWNFQAMGGWLHTFQETPVEPRCFKLMFGKANHAGSVLEFVDYLDTILNPVIPRAFTEIHVNPAKISSCDDKGGLTMLIEIAKETNCDVDYGNWLTPVTFKPETNVQYNAVLELLDTFGMPYNNYTKGADK